MEAKYLNMVFERFKQRGNGCCPFCGLSIENMIFADELSVKEFMVSGLCQVCQDKVFVDE